jgi:glycosyltransferase involved in cell wall biosynthesis
VGSKEAQLKQQMSDLQLKNVQFAGYIDDINEEFRKASVFVCSTTSLDVFLNFPSGPSV